MAAELTRESYHYEPLPCNQSIRLLQLSPGNTDQRVQCHLQTVNVQSCPPYEAISYVWGPPDERTHILCHGLLIEIPTNLFYCLQRLRQEHEHRTLWADSICINQKDLEERSSQVRIMGSIYERAERVIVWFGCGLDFDARAAFDLVKSLAPRSRDFSRQKPLSLNEEAEFRSYAEQIPSPQWEAFGTLVKNPWLTRGWVLQEIGLARDGLVICGVHETPWRDLLRMTRYVDWSCQKLVYDYKLWLFEVHRFHDLDFWDSTIHLGQLMECMRNFETSDPRDKIYAILAHKTFRAQRYDIADFIPIDYELPHSQIYLGMARFLLKHPHPFFVLALVDHTHEISSGEHRRISWVPQWDVRNPRFVFYYEASYIAAKRTEPQLSQNGLSLEVKGLFIDSIEWRSDSLDDEELESATREGKEYLPLTDVLKRVNDLKGDPRALEERFRQCCLTLNAGDVVRGGRGYRPKLSADDRVSDFLALLKETSVHLESTTYLEERYGLGNAWRSLETLRPCYQRRFFMTKKGYFGIGPEISLPGDKVCVFFGGRVPFVLRPQADNEYTLCGECYVYRFMDGQAVDMWERGELEDETFTMI